MDNILKITGTKTPKTKVYKSESHKLCQAFPIAKDEIINEGAPVGITAAGTVKAYKGGDATSVYIGVATSYSENSPYPGYHSGTKDQTVMVSGCAVVYGVGGTTGIANAGYVNPTGVDANGYTTYVASAEGAATSFIALHAAAEGELVQVMVK